MTYDPGLYGCIKANASSHYHKYCRYYTHRYESKLPLNGECNNVCREEERDAHNTCVHLLGYALIDTVAV